MPNHHAYNWWPLPPEGWQTIPPLLPQWEAIALAVHPRDGRVSALSAPRWWGTVLVRHRHTGIYVLYSQGHPSYQSVPPDWAQAVHRAAASAAVRAQGSE